MRKLFFFINILFLFTCLQGKEIETGLEKLKTLKTLVTEERKVVDNKNEILISEYELVISLPNKLKKIQLAPEMNKGEIYIYSEGEKTIYLPFFDQMTKEKIPPNEKTIVDYLNEIIKLSKEDKVFSKEYVEKGMVTFSSGENIKVVLKGISSIEGIYLPKVIEIFEKDNKIGKITFEKVEINIAVKESEFKLKDE